MSDGRARSVLRRATSLRGKIAGGHLLGFLFLLVVATLLFANLVAVEERFASWTASSRLLDATLEMRRYEKNWLLYGEPSDLAAAIDYARAAQVVLARDHPGSGETTRLLEEYVALLREVERGGARARHPAVDTVRELGRRVTQVAERRSAAEAQDIQRILTTSRRRLVALVVASLVATALLARMIWATALRPLRDLEGAMQRIAAGELRMLPVGPGDDEIAAMNAAFNRMIGEILGHREEAMRQEKLASLGTMLAGIAHEINNPLLNISTSAELLEEEDDRLSPGERRELVRQITSQTERATEIIRMVLEYGREPRHDARPTNLLATLLEAVALIRARLPADVSVGLDVASGIEVLGSKTRLQQAFINLMANAVDAMREAGRDGAITVSARCPPGEGTVEIVFRDRGAGIAPGVVDRIFDPFFSTKEVGHGTGLGLYVTHQIVEQHGGTIAVASSPGEGTAFTIRMPRIVAASPAGGDVRAGGGAR